MIYTPEAIAEAEAHDQGLNDDIIIAAFLEPYGAVATQTGRYAEITVPDPEEKARKIAEYEARKEERADRYRELAEKNELQGDQHYERFKQMSDLIPLGQPILVGHYSEGSDRAYRARMGGQIDKAHDCYEKSKYYAEKAQTVINNRSISGDDPGADDKIKDKLERLERLQDRMKEANKIVRMKITDPEKIERLQALGLNAGAELLKPDYMGRTGYPTWQLSNNNAEIRRLKDRLALIEKRQSEVTVKMTIGKVDIIDNVDANRIQVYFAYIPAEQVRKQLKHNGFRWSPSNGCWQANRGAYRLQQAKEIITAAEAV